MQNRYYIFGIQRSGTNYLETLLQRNFGAKKLNPTGRTWKHSTRIPDGYNRAERTVIIYKNPYTWVESLCFRNNVDWLKKQLEFPADKKNENPLYNVGPRSFNIENLCKTYRKFHMDWVWHREKNTDRSIVIRYEDLLGEQSRNEQLEKIRTKFGFNKASPVGWRNVERGKVSQSRDYDMKREEYYLNMRPDTITREQIDCVNDTIGKELISKLGYPVL